MIAVEIIGKVLDAGGQITADGPDLVLTAPRPLPDELLDRIKADKSDIVKALRQPPPSKRRGLGGYGTPPGVPPLGDCALARQIRAMNRAASPAMPDDDPVPGNEASTMPHVSLDATPPNLPGVSPDLAARLSAEDLEEIKAGHIPLGTVQQYEQAAIAREAEDLKEFSGPFRAPGCLLGYHPHLKGIGASRGYHHETWKGLVTWACAFMFCFSACRSRVGIWRERPKR
jgi:hypothetical protein